MIDKEKFKKILRIFSSEKNKVPTQDLKYILDNLQSGNTMYKAINEEYDRRIAFDALEQQKKANSLTKEANFWNKWGIKISLIMSLGALLISIFF